MDLEHQAPQPISSELQPPQPEEKGVITTLFGVECLVDKIGMGFKSPFFNIKCRTAADAEIIVKAFWREYDPRLYAEIESGISTYENFGGTAQARTNVVHVEYQPIYKCIISVNQNGNPFRKDTLDVFRNGGLSI